MNQGMNPEKQTAGESTNERAKYSGCAECHLFCTQSLRMWTNCSWSC